MLCVVSCFELKTSPSTEKKHLTGKCRHPSIAFVANIICTYLRFQ